MQRVSFCFPRYRGIRYLSTCPGGFCAALQVHPDNSLLLILAEHIAILANVNPSVIFTGGVGGRKERKKGGSEGRKKNKLLGKVVSLSLSSSLHSWVALCLGMPCLTHMEHLLIRCLSKRALKMFMLLWSVD